MGLNFQQNKEQKPVKSLNYIGKDGLIHNIYYGDQNSQSLKKSSTELRKLAGILRKKKIKVLILADVSRIKKVNLGAKKTGLELMRSLDFDKAAIFGDYIKFKSLVNIITIAAGKSDRVKFFSNEEDATNWLLSKN